MNLQIKANSLKRTCDETESDIQILGNSITLVEAKIKKLQ